MLIVGEKINATRKAVGAAIEQRNAEHIAKLAREQVEAGSDYLDANGGSPHPGAEPENMRWLVQTIQQTVDVPLCLDSADPEAIQAGLELVKHKPIINSITLESDRWDRLIDVVSNNDCYVIALCMSDEGPPSGVDDRIARAAELVDRLTSAGKDISDIFVDVCIFPVAVQPDSAKMVFEALRQVKQRFPQVRTIGGVSNSSHGLPQRKFINYAYIANAVVAGLDAAICDPCTPNTVGIIRAAEVLAGRDEMCMNYVTAHQQGKLK